MRRNTTSISERDLVGPALRLLDEAPDGFISTSDLIEQLTDIFNPTGKDAEIIPGRNDTYFSQKVRNLVSHRDRNFISEGLAAYDSSGDGGLRITNEGRQHLQRMRPR